jgi:hypothetical protein
MSESSFGILAAGLVTKSTDELIQELGVIAQGRKTTAAEGAVKVGPSKSIGQPAGVEALAADYCDSLKTSRRSFPYFADVEGAS